MRLATQEKDGDSMSRPWLRMEQALASRTALCCVLVLAALLRLGHILQLRRLPLFDGLLLDSAFYDQWAQGIASGNWLGGERAFYMDPLYPYLLALLYRCFGHDLLVVRLFQAGLGMATCGLVAMIGNRVGGRAVGTLAALAMAVYRPAIFNECEIEKTALGLFLVTAALMFATRRSGAAKFGAGVCLALAILTRGNLLAMVPLGALFFLADSGQSDETTPPCGFFERWLGRLRGAPGRHTLAFLLGCTLIFSPVLWRNHHVSGDWVLTTSQAGTNFYIGNNPANATGGFWPLPFVRLTPLYEEGDFRAETEARTGKSMTPKEISSFWFHEAITHIQEHPRFAITMFLAKFMLFWSNEELPDGWDMHFLERYSMVLRMPLLGMGWLLPLAVIGACTSFRRNRDVRLLTGFAVVYSFSVIAFYLFSRYRLHVVPILAVLAALGLQWMCEKMRKRDLRQVVLGSITLVAVGSFSFLAVPLFASGHHEWSHNFIDLAWLYEAKGDYTSARKLLDEALRLEPDRTDTLCTIGRLYQKEGNYNAAVNQLEQCLAIDENYQEAWYLLGVSYEALGNVAAAGNCYQKQLSLVPDHRPSSERLENLKKLRNSDSRQK